MGQDVEIVDRTQQLPEPGQVLAQRVDCRRNEGNGSIVFRSSIPAAARRCALDGQPRGPIPAHLGVMLEISCIVPLAMAKRTQLRDRRVPAELPVPHFRNGCDAESSILAPRSPLGIALGSIRRPATPSRIDVEAMPWDSISIRLREGRARHDLGPLRTSLSSRPTSTRAPGHHLDAPSMTNERLKLLPSWPIGREPGATG